MTYKRWPELRYRRGEQDPRALWLTSDRKVSPLQSGVAHGGTSRRPGETYWVPRWPNTFGLPSGPPAFGGTCPGQTKFCESCYAAAIEPMHGVREMLEHNRDLLQAADGVDGMVVLLAEMMEISLDEAERLGVPLHDMIFRWHWDGDFYSLDYARAAAIVIGLFPQVISWVYTRSFTRLLNVVPILSGLPNLSLYLSVDPYNVGEAMVAQAGSDAKWALCADDMATAQSLIPGVRAVACPENMRNSSGERVRPLVSNGRGVCSDCRMCIDDHRHIIFSVSGQLHAGQIHGQTSFPGLLGELMQGAWF